jgi:hypothetical protein
MVGGIGWQVWPSVFSINNVEPSGSAVTAFYLILLYFISFYFKSFFFVLFYLWEFWV